MENRKIDKEIPVVIIGGGLTGLSLAAQLDMEGLPFVLLERSDRVGGQVRTLRENGFVYEVGPNTGTISTPEVAELFEYAAPDAELEVADSAANSRWIWKGNRFYPIPSGLWGGLTTPLYSWRDKLGMPLEPFRRKGTNPNETVGELAERRLGKSIVDYTIDPFIGGIYAGDPYQLVTRLALPKLYNLEQKYGSFIGGALRKAREPKSDRERKATKKIFSAVGGLEHLIASVVQKVVRTGRIELEVREIMIEEEGKSWVTSFVDAHGERHSLVSQHVVTTVRADILPSLFPNEWQGYFTNIATLPYAPVAEVSVGFKHLPHIPRAAFGALVPSREKRDVLGILFPSSCFRGRTEYSDGALFTVFMGGLRNREMFVDSSEEQLMRLGLEELYLMMKIPRGIQPDMVHIERYPKAIPQYDLATDARHNDIKRIEMAYPGLHLAGGMIGGIGMANRITQGMELGKMIAENYG